MRRFNAVAPAWVGALVAATLAASAAETSPVSVPRDVKIPVALTQALTSQTAHVGDRFSFKTTKAENLGGLDVPVGTPGHGRIAIATAAEGKSHGSLALQTDSLDLPDGRNVSVDVDVNRPPRGHLSDKHTRFFVLPVPTIGILPALIRSQSGNLVLDAGTGFGVVTVTPRSVPAPLYTLAPRTSPTSAPGAMPSTGPSAAAEPSAPPAPSAAPRPSATPSLR